MQKSFNEKRKSILSRVCGVCVMTAIVVLLLAGAVFADTTPPAPQVNVNVDYNAAAGQVVVTVALENNPGIVSFKGNLNYNSKAFKPVSVVDEGLLNGCMFPEQEDGSPDYDKCPYPLMWYDINAVTNTKVNNAANGKIATLTFDILGDGYGDFDFEFTSDPGNTQALVVAPGVLLENVTFTVSQTDNLGDRYALVAEYNEDGKMTAIKTYDRTKQYKDPGTGLFSGFKDETKGYIPLMCHFVQ